MNTSKKTPLAIDIFVISTAWIFHIPSACNLAMYLMDLFHTSTSSKIYFVAGAASQAVDADSSRAPGLTFGLQGSVNVHRGALLLVPQ